MDKGIQAIQQVIDTYPPQPRRCENLSIFFGIQGEYHKAAELARQVAQLAPEYLAGYEQLANMALALQRFDEARWAIHQAQGRKLDDFILHNALYALAFLGAEPSKMAEEQQWFASHSSVENSGLSLAADTEGYVGHLGQARELTQRSVDSALRADSKETGGIWWENAALREAAFGYLTEARQAAAAGLKIYPASQGVRVEAALAYAMIGDTARANSLAEDLNKRYPLDTQMQSLWLPAIRAQRALNRKNPAEALAHLQSALPPIEYGQTQFVNNISCLYPTYVRGQAYLSAGQGKEAATEFQKILDHPGIVWNCWTGALARLGIARANAIQAKNSSGADADLARRRALAAYKDFLTLWKDADPDIPIYKEAKAGYAQLQ